MITRFRVHFLKVSLSSPDIYNAENISKLYQKASKN